MSRDPLALHIGMDVITPSGPGRIKARVNGPLTRWVVNDYPWPEAQITVPDPPEPQPQPDLVCRACTSSNHCFGDGGIILAGLSAPCGCRCGRGPQWRDELEPDEVA